LEKVTAIIKKAPPEAVEKLRAGSVKIDKIYKQVQREEKRQKLLTQALLELPEGCNLIQGDFTSISSPVSGSSPSPVSAKARIDSNYGRLDIYRPTI
jgi:hypothetical protein